MINVQVWNFSDSYDQLLEMGSNRTQLGYTVMTGHPVIIAIIAEGEVQAIVTLVSKVAEIDIGLPACIMKCRNNEMINLIAKYFL